MHQELWQIVRRLDTDYEPFGKAEREGPDCSSGCRHFIKLAGDVGNDWGVCSNPESPRAGLLTFEHQGWRIRVAASFSMVKKAMAAGSTPPGSPPAQRGSGPLP